MSIPN